MCRRRRLEDQILVTTISIRIPTAHAQSVPTATQLLQLSVFVAGTDTFASLAAGKNLDITAGFDFTVLTFSLLKPSVEIRGTYPVEKGSISRQKDFLVGPKIECPKGRLRLYGDFITGRGKIDYQNSGFIFRNVKYISSTTIVYSPGLGLDFNPTHNLAIRTAKTVSVLSTCVTKQTKDMRYSEAEP